MVNEVTVTAATQPANTDSTATNPANQPTIPLETDQVSATASSTEEELRFSSFAYRIEAARILARALAIAMIHDIHRDQIQAIDNALAAWPHYLDLGKAEPTDVSGEVDDTLLQAHMLIQYTIMIIHFPRSDLTGAIPTTASDMPTSSLLPVYSRSMHGVKAVEASKRLGNLAGLQDSVQKHSPFFLSGLLLSSIVQLSACSLRPSGFQQPYRDRLCLTTGVLKTLSPVWALARSTWGTINAMTLEALSKNNQLISRQQSLLVTVLSKSEPQQLSSVSRICHGWNFQLGTQGNRDVKGAIVC